MFVYIWTTEKVIIKHGGNIPIFITSIYDHSQPFLISNQVALFLNIYFTDPRYIGYT